MNDILVSLNNERYSQATYYRILSPIIFDIDRIIHIDADTLVLKDLDNKLADFNKENRFDDTNLVAKSINELAIGGLYSLLNVFIVSS